MSTATIEKPAVTARPGAVPEVRRTFVLQNLNGLHARPAALLVHTLEDYRCRVRIECGGYRVNAMSIFGLLTLAAGPGSKLTFIAVGPEAAPALDAVGKLIQNNFADPK